MLDLLFRVSILVRVLYHECPFAICKEHQCKSEAKSRASHVGHKGFPDETGDNGGLSNGVCLTCSIRRWSLVTTHKMSVKERSWVSLEGTSYCTDGEKSMIQTHYRRPRGFAPSLAFVPYKEEPWKQREPDFKTQNGGYPNATARLVVCGQWRESPTTAAALCWRSLSSRGPDASPVGGYNLSSCSAAGERCVDASTMISNLPAFFDVVPLKSMRSQSCNWRHASHM